jgi:hypothetical protein
MGIKDEANEMKDKAKGALDREGGDEKIDTAADRVNEKTGDKYSEQVDKGADMAKDRFDNP